jgi:hypothetical protein
MSRAASESAVGLADLLYQFGEPITYTPAGAVGVPMTAIVTPERIEEDETFDGRRRRRVREATISTDAAGDFGGVASPSITASVTIGGVKYAVENINSLTENINSLTDNQATLGLVRRDKTETGRESYRRK